MPGLPPSAVNDDRYLPGHLGALTAYLPPELVEAVLAETGRLQQRLRLLPSRCDVYFVLALCLFPQLGMALVWEKLVHAWGLRAPRPTSAALRQLRARLSPAPLRALFEVLAVPLAPAGTPGVGYRGLRTVAFDGCHSLHVPDTVDNRAWLGRVRTRLGWAGYPALNVMTLSVFSVASPG
ncbi:transposase domain-containing protein [Streptomyces sp. NPDC059534]|uniref:transposase domain-containing protein n=1 Tax=Streptomyces sp. NPDC059534 TaxID=3346859 RepID=UPI0036C4749B